MRDQTYINTFVGIPLPDKYQHKYAALLNELKKFDFLRTVNPRNPHITIYYLGEQMLTDLEAVSKVVERHFHKVKGEQLKISGMGYFTQRNPRILYLKVEASPKLNEFYEYLSGDLKEFYKPDHPKFTPHLTLANVKNSGDFKEAKNVVSNILTTFRVEFAIKEVSVYGRMQSEQTKLFSIN